MKIETQTTVFFTEADVRQVLKDYLTARGLNVIGEFEIITRDPSVIPTGARPCDQIGIMGKVTVVEEQQKTKEQDHG